MNDLAMQSKIQAFQFGFVADAQPDGEIDQLEQHETDDTRPDQPHACTFKLKQHLPGLPSMRPPC